MIDVRWGQTRTNALPFTPLQTIVAVAVVATNDFGSGDRRGLWDNETPGIDKQPFERSAD